ncbi:hypothetical protein F4703DRAFT_1749625 [Phycomyces blakesleeanus]
MRYKKQRIWIVSERTGFIQPRPIDSVLVMAILTNSLRAIQTFLVLTNTYPNVIFRSFIHEFPWQFAVSALSCYFFGISHTIADSSTTLSNEWFRSPLLIDKFCTFVFIIPFITNNIFSICSGIYAHRGEIDVAYIFTRALHLTWGIYCFCIFVILFSSGYLLLRVLKRHRATRIRNGSDISVIDTGIIKVKIIVTAGGLATVIFTFFSFMYGIFRNTITMNPVLSTGTCVIWMIDVPLVTLLIEIAILLTPKITVNLGLSDHSSNEDNMSYPRRGSRYSHRARSSSLPQNRQHPKQGLQNKLGSAQKRDSKNEYVFAMDVISSNLITNSRTFDIEGTGPFNRPLSAPTSPGSPTSPGTPGTSTRPQYNFQSKPNNISTDSIKISTVLSPPPYHSNKEPKKRSVDITRSTNDNS